jgi:hypothetical protein
MTNSGSDPGQASRWTRAWEAEPGSGSPGLDVDRNGGEHESEKNRHTYLPIWHPEGRASILTEN